MPRASTTKPADPEKQLEQFIGKFEPTHQAVICAARKALRKRFPTATELAYDNYNFFLIGFGPNERPSDCIVSIAAAANGVGLCFIRGASLPDPGKVLLALANRHDLFAFLQQKFFGSLRFKHSSRSPQTEQRRHCLKAVAVNLSFAQFH
jgi:hypothetical protein